MLFSEVLDFVTKHRDKGRSGSFDFPPEVLDLYIVWAFKYDYLITVHEDGHIVALIIAAPLRKDFDKNDKKLFKFDEFIPISQEQDHPLGILDFICISPTARKEIVHKLITRFKNFENQKKWAMRFNKVVEIPNNYIIKFYNS